VVKLYTTKEVAEKLGYADDSVIRRLIYSRKIKAEKVGKTWVLTEEGFRDVKKFREQKRKLSAKK
jgi:excisionase family DNA binding protein